MILTAGVDIEGAIYLFEEDNAHKAVREGHFREREPHIGGFFDIGAEAVGAADDKADGRTSADGEPIEGCGELLGRELRRVDTEGDGIGALRDGGEDLGIGLAGLDDAEFGVCGDTFSVLVGGVGEIAFLIFAGTGADHGNIQHIR